MSDNIIILQQQQEIDNLKKIIFNLEKKLEKFESNDNTIEIFIYKYKKSFILSNKNSDKNTTYKCKHILKELGGKWFNQEKGWIFTGIFKDDDIIKNVKFILDKLSDEGFNVDYTLK